ncbi:putative ATP-dependent RNA helicase DDX59 isoform X1 [Phytophthora cinnamomi]|uniref:putative ATP-dependent RNA helicase DDX59 isoform X1 n=1 Tax=Phytophthora cinnamomi TaxID=4785 RepID=UPI0035595A51|nr:putative ATP-dependent RNA helicase DDX59 isoform X1 [Phytophthora cinnamomi]
MTDVTIVERSAAQRQPQAGEPVCVICGRYGEYVCDATDEDVCSLECRDVCTARQGKRHLPLSSQLQDKETLERAEQLRSRLGIKVSAAENGAQPPARPIPLVDFAQEHHGVPLPAELLANLGANGFERPTPVQMQTIPCALQGHHVLVSAPTGTGKTASYLIPAVAQILFVRKAEQEKEDIVALVLAPIRELAIQIESEAKVLMQGIADMKTALLVGGFPVPNQRYRLQNGVQLIVATPGRFLDIFTNYGGGEAILAAIRTCIVDEVDVMLDVGFWLQISQIVDLLVASAKKYIKGVQLLFFSATVPVEVEELVRRLLKNFANQAYIRVSIGCNDRNATGAISFSLNPLVQHQVKKQRSCLLGRKLAPQCWLKQLKNDAELVLQQFTLINRSRKGSLFWKIL